MNSADDPPPLTPKPFKDPPIVVFQPEFNDPLEQLWKTLLSSLNEPAYGAQRVFDLFTLMAITLAFGLLFGAMKALAASTKRKRISGTTRVESPSGGERRAIDN